MQLFPISEGPNEHCIHCQAAGAARLASKESYLGEVQVQVLFIPLAGIPGFR